MALGCYGSLDRDAALAIRLRHVTYSPRCPRTRMVSAFAERSAMYYHASAALVVALGLTVSSPPTLRAQYRTVATVGATTRPSIDAAPRSNPSDRPLAPVLPARPDSTPPAHSL